MLPTYRSTLPSLLQSPQQAELKNNRVSVMFGTPDDADRVANYLGEYLTEQGWAPASQRIQDKVMIQGRKQGRAISVLVARTDEGTDSEITLIAVSVDR
jgi:hypothetical protein